MNETVRVGQSASRVAERTAKFILLLDRLALDVAQHWLAYINFVLGVLVITPFLAPAFMALGWTGPANAIYIFYSFLCHQLPERSFFLLGHKVSYSLAEISRAYPYTNVFDLRQFIGNEAMGWKVAWSDRMVALYGSFWIGGLLFAALRRRLTQGGLRISLLAWVLLALVPMGVDGISHMINDAVAGVSGAGFRDTNVWLAFLTGNIFPAKFYAGDALGSFNNLVRLATGMLTGLTTIWLLYPLVDSAMHDLASAARKQVASAHSQP